MAIDEFDENRTLVDRSHFDFEVFSIYLKKNGIEKASGYIDAIRDITTVINGFLTTTKGNDCFRSTNATIAGKTKELNVEALGFLSNAERMVEISKNKKPAKIKLKNT